ncbi:MAG: family 16 glycoside hydrolase [Verrucomicrobiia bacterium]
MKPLLKSFALVCLLAIADGWNSRSVAAEPPDVNYDEGRVPAYVLPDPLLSSSGAKITDLEQWREVPRPEIIRLYQEHVYGRNPRPARPIQFEVASVDPQALGGKATRKQVTVFLTGERSGPRMHLLLFLPNGAPKAVPAFLGLNFYGNHCVHSDPGIELSSQWMRPNKQMGVVNNRATEASRGLLAGRWQVEKLIGRGYALATVYYGDIEPDFAHGWKMGVRAALGEQGTNTVFKPDDWGAIGAWAWGLSRAMDYLEQDDGVDARRVAVIGHSRLGKTALWAGALDERMAIVISNNSGEGGASLARRRFGETIKHLVDAVPYWFCPRYRDYAERENALPVDAHMLIALMAPRPVYVASAAKDLWADPRGEFLAAKNAEPVYRLFGLGGLGVDQMPAPDRPVGDRIGYHVRSGDHDVTAYDWDQYLHFADRHFQHGELGRTTASTTSSSAVQTAEIKLLTQQAANGEFPGWNSFLETPGTKTGDVWSLGPDGVLICRGSPKGYLYTEADYTDFVLSFEWRYPAGAAQSNGGVLVRMTGEHSIWPRSLEFQLNMGQAGDFWGLRGYEFSGPAERLKVIPTSPFGALRHLPRTSTKEGPPGEWNHFEGVVEGEKVTQKVNGIVVNEATACEVVPGKILLTAEGQEIHFRNLRLLPKP